MTENSATIDVLRIGQESTDKLKTLLRNMPQPEVLFLLENISDSFSKALECLNIPAACLSDERLIVSTGTKRGLQPTRKIGRRSRVSSDSCKKVLNKSIDDEFTWRKYGQKEIYSSKFPRSYFRCTYKHMQNCQATRQVQKSEQNPDMFEITYIRQHTCEQAKNKKNNESSRIIDFGSNSDQQVPPFSPSPLSTPKREDEVISDQNFNSATSSEQAVSPNVIGQLTDVFMGSPNDCDTSSLGSTCDALEEFNHGEFFDIQNLFFFDHQYQPPF